MGGLGERQGPWCCRAWRRGFGGPGSGQLAEATETQPVPGVCWQRKAVGVNTQLLHSSDLSGFGATGCSRLPGTRN